MGADTFYQKAKGKTAKAAFTNAQKAARHDHGHSGYTGTIAEKNEFVLIPLPAGANPEAEADRLISEDDSRVTDKWGPAGCFDLGNGEYYFFGWASS